MIGNGGTLRLTEEERLFVSTDEVLDGNRFAHHKFFRLLDKKRYLRYRTEIIPAKVFAGRYYQIEIRIYIDNILLKKNAHILVKPSPWLGGNKNKYNYYTFQVTNPWADGYITASTSRGDRLKVHIRGAGPSKKSHNLIQVTNDSEDLVCGDFVIIKIGDNEYSRGIYTQEYSAHEKSIIAVDPDANNDYYKIQPQPVIEIIGNSATHFLINAAGTPKLMENTRLTIVAVDNIHDNPDHYYNGELKIVKKEQNNPYEKTINCSRKNHGVFSINDLSFSSKGIHRVKVIDEKKQISAISNPIVPEFLSNNYKIFFGDIHGHNQNCDGAGSTDDYFLWGRDVMNLDFCALTNHADQSHTLELWTKKKWRKIREAVEEYNCPSKFITFFGYEWTKWQDGHRNVYFLDEDAPVYSHEMEGTNNPQKLWDKLKDRNAITILHHPTFGCNTKYLSPPQIEPLMEIFSIWGCHEVGEHPLGISTRENANYRKLLSLGYKLGVIAGTDNHLGRPAHGWTYNVRRTVPNPNHSDKSLRDRNSSPDFGNGLACIIAKELTREEIFSAMKRRRTYATTGPRILLDFRINDHFMGEEITGKKAFNLKLRVIGTQIIEKVEIIRNGAVYRTKSGGSIHEEIETEVELIPQKETYFYARVMQVDGHLAWSSPIWCGRDE